MKTSLLSLRSLSILILAIIAGMFIAVYELALVGKRVPSEKVALSSGDSMCATSQTTAAQKTNDILFAGCGGFF